MCACAHAAPYTNSEIGASRTSKRLPAPAQGAGWTISQENPAWLQGGLGIRHVGGAHHPARCRHAGDCATFLLARFRQPRTRTDMLQRSRGVCSHTAHNPGCKMLEALPAFLRCSPSPRRAARDRSESVQNLRGAGALRAGVAHAKCRASRTWRLVPHYSRLRCHYAHVIARCTRGSCCCYYEGCISRHISPHLAISRHISPSARYVRHIPPYLAI